MSNVAFLLIVVVVAVIGSLAVWWRNRRPTTFMSSVEEFRDEMRALGRDQTPGEGGSWRDRAGRGVGPPPSRSSRTSPAGEPPGSGSPPSDDDPAGR